MLLVNGSIGLTTGFTQKILQRNPEDLIKWILCKLDNKKYTGKLLPWYKGFKGNIKVADTSNSFIIEGHYNKINNNTIEIDELPVGYDLAQYIKVLDQLVEDKKIKDYNDYSENGNFKFKVTFFRNQGLDLNNCDVISELKLYKTYTEIYTALNENNLVVEYVSPFEILENYYKIRYNFYIKRKEYLIKELESNIRLLASKYIFIKNVIDGELEIRNKSNEYIINKLNNIKNIIKYKNSYDYLLNMPMSSITKEKYIKLLLEKCINFEYSYTGFKNDETTDVMISQPQAYTTAKRSSPAGIYPIYLSGAMAKNYEITYNESFLLVQKAPLTIQVLDATRKRLEENPKFELSITGYKLEETIDVLDKLPTIQCEANCNSPAGTYPIILLNDGVDANYEYVLVNGILTIEKLQFTISVESNDEMQGTVSGGGTYDEKYNISTKECHFCIDFVIDSALKLQGFDYDISNVIR